MNQRLQYTAYYLAGDLRGDFAGAGSCTISRRGGVGEERSELEERGLSVGGGSGGVGAGGASSCRCRRRCRRRWRRRRRCRGARHACRRRWYGGCRGRFGWLDHHTHGSRRRVSYFGGRSRDLLGGREYGRLFRHFRPPFSPYQLLLVSRPLAVSRLLLSRLFAPPRSRHE